VIPDYDPAEVIVLLRYYLRQEDTNAERSEFMGILESHLADRAFGWDLHQLLRVGVVYDPRQAANYVKEKLLSRLPDR
jgi:hypothetical protein